MVHGYEALSEKEKETLRLLLDGHDAKSIARHLSLSVHTINERLRFARRKFSVSSSKEAARLLRHAEADVPKMIGDKSFGDATGVSIGQSSEIPIAVSRQPRRAMWVVGGLAMISIFATMMILSTPSEAPQPAPLASQATQMPAASSPVVKAALDWLQLVEQEKWRESWAATSKSFQELNTVDAWQSASERVQSSLGRVLSRKLLDEQDIPAPPNGYRMVRFRTDFEKKPGAVETLSLDYQDGQWKVVGIYIE